MTRFETPRVAIVGAGEIGRGWAALAVAAGWPVTIYDADAEILSPATEAIGGDVLRERIAADPDADVLVHPECACATSALSLVASGAVPKDRVRIVSTGGMVDAARRTGARRVLVATETGMLHQLRRANPGTVFEPVSARAVCPYMKMINRDNLLAALRDGRDVVEVDPDVAARARRAVERMVAIGSPSAGGE